jgi:hypothetical protein
MSLMGWPISAVHSDGARETPFWHSLIYSNQSQFSTVNSEVTGDADEPTIAISFTKRYLHADDESSPL